VYSWTDENGEVHYGDQPPESVKQEDIKEIKVLKGKETPPETAGSPATVCSSAANNITRHKAHLKKLANNKIKSKDGAVITNAINAQMTYHKLTGMSSDQIKKKCEVDGKRTQFFTCAANAQDGDSLALCVISNQYWL